VLAFVAGNLASTSNASSLESGIGLSAAARLEDPALGLEPASASTPTPSPTPLATSTPEPEQLAAPEPERQPFPPRDESRLYVEYVVQTGDTLGVIADHYELSVDDVFWSNPGLADADLVIEGETLKVPSMDGIVHVSVGGETVYDVALKYGVTVESLTWFAPNQTPDPFQTLADGTEVLVLHANPPIAEEAPPPAETPPPAEGETPPAEGAEPPAEGATPGPTPAPGEAPAPPPPPPCQPTVASAPCFIWPVEGKVTSGYGPRSDVGFHDGIDIDVPDDGNHTQVVAAAAGDVVWAGCDDSGYGCYVIIDHGFGWKTRYDHFSTIQVVAGQRVQQGELLGMTGCTGYCRGEHLHLAILFEGKAVDPIAYLPPR
jgi:murein DD-endopeptidase MepM/ murein hydrolase activator NlpD